MLVHQCACKRSSAYLQYLICCQVRVAEGEVVWSNRQVVVLHYRPQVVLQAFEVCGTRHCPSKCSANSPLIAKY